MRYKSGVVGKVKFEYSPLGEALSKVNKVNKESKYDKDFLYNSMHNLNKYSVSNFNKISSIDSKFNTLDNFSKEFKKLKAVKSQNEETKQKKITVLKIVSLCYNELIDNYKKEYNQAFKRKDQDRTLKYDYKNLKDLDYQLDQPQQTKNRFNEIQSKITEAKDNGLSTKINNKKITMNNEEKLVKDIVSGIINKNEARHMYDVISDEANIIINS